MRQQHEQVSACCRMGDDRVSRSERHPAGGCGRRLAVGMGDSLGGSGHPRGGSMGDRSPGWTTRILQGAAQIAVVEASWSETVDREDTHFLSCRSAEGRGRVHSRLWWVSLGGVLQRNAPESGGGR